MYKIVTDNGNKQTTNDQTGTSKKAKTKAIKKPIKLTPFQRNLLNIKFNLSKISFFIFSVLCLNFLIRFFVLNLYL
jgi:hypothetical protein